jgi:Xaa-Pro aminopeptidase
MTTAGIHGHTQADKLANTGEVTVTGVGSMSEPEPKPQIPASEYPERWRKVQAMMAVRHLDFLVAYADDRAAFGPAHARWLANFPTHFEPACVLMPRDGDPAMLVGPESDQYALLAGQIHDVRVLRELTHPDEDYPYARIQSLADVMTDIGRGLSGAKRVGLGGRGLIGADLMAAFRDALPSAEWVDVENALCDLRAQKSPAELDVIRHAYKIAEIGILAGIDAIAPGVTEREVAAEIESAMRRAGSEGAGIDTIVASGPNSRPILARSTFRHIGRDDLVLLTVAPRYEGYHAAIGRLVLVGDPGPEVVRALDTAIQAQEASSGALRPGVEGREVESIGREIVEAADLGRYFLYSGLHSVGVIEFEPPIFGPSSPARLKQDMVISIDIPMFNTPWGGLRIEDGYVITATGAEPLSRVPYRLRK